MKKENKLYRLLNETETNITAYEELEVSTIEKENLLKSVIKQKKKAKKKVFKIQQPLVLACAFIIVILFGSQTSLGKSVQATASSLLENIHYSLYQVFGLDSTEETDAALSINQVASIENAEVKIEDMLYFDGELLLNVLIDLEETIEEKQPISFVNISISIDGELLTSEVPIGSGGIIDENNNVSQFSLRIPLAEEIFISDSFSLEILLQDIHVYNPGKVSDTPIYMKGDAAFSVETTIDSLKKHTNVVTINQDLSVNELDYHIEQLTLHPILSFIDLNSPDGEQEYQLMEFRGVNDKGERIVFVPNTYRTTIDYWEGTMMFLEEDSEITTKELTESKWIQLQLYSAGHPEGEAHYKTYGEPFTIKLQK